VAKYDKAVFSDRLFQKAREGRSVAILLLEIHRRQGLHFLMQISEDDSPDVRTVTLQEIPNNPVHGYFQEIEVVNLGPHSLTENIIEFLKQTKLSKEKSYDEKTIILCQIDKDMVSGPWEGMHSELKYLNPKFPIYIMGKVSKDQEIYRICHVWDELERPSDIDISTLAKSYPKPDTVVLTLSVEKNITFKPINRSRPSVFEILHLNEVDIINKFGK
jgi:hypothetical protein